MTWSMTYPTVGAMFHVTLVATCSGASYCWSLMLPIATRSFSCAASITPNRSANRTSAPDTDLRERRFLGGGGVEPAVQEGDLDVDVGVDLLRARR